MAPAIVGTDIDVRRQTIDAFLQRYDNGRPVYIKAASLVDVALWDLAAKSAGMPLFKMPCGFRDTVPVMVVAGYYIDQRTIEDVREEVRQRLDEGFSRIKIMISGLDPTTTKTWYPPPMRSPAIGSASMLTGPGAPAAAHVAQR